jgi:spore maturation protein CgeB
MRVLFVWPAAEFSVWDVARGYRAALAKRIGEENIRDYFLNKHANYHIKALTPEAARDITILSKASSECALNEAIYGNVDLVVIISGLNFHPITLWALKKVGIKAAVIFTESPYEDANQASWKDEAYPEMFAFTNERTSAEQRGWVYLPAAFSPEIHQLSMDPIKQEHDCDVVMIGTGWRERQMLLEQVNWDGINLKLKGLWPELTEASPLWKFYNQEMIDNTGIKEYYRAAKVCLNLHRGHATAESMNPRAYEVAACGGFQICDDRPEIRDVFGDSVLTFRTPPQLEKAIRWAINPVNRFRRAEMIHRAHQRVQAHTFDARMDTFLDTVVKGGVPAPTGQMVTV